MMMMTRAFHYLYLLLVICHMWSACWSPRKHPKKQSAGYWSHLTWRILHSKMGFLLVQNSGATFCSPSQSFHQLQLLPDFIMGIQVMSWCYQFVLKSCWWYERKSTKVYDRITFPKIHPRKFTCSLKRNHFKRKIHLPIFRKYAGFRVRNKHINGPMCNATSPLVWHIGAMGGWSKISWFSFDKTLSMNKNPIVSYYIRCFTTRTPWL